MGRAAVRPQHHRPEGGFRNPPGSPRRENYRRGLLRLFLTLPFARPPAVPHGHVLPRDEMTERIRTARNPSVTWLGHAAFIVRLAGKTILTDPFLGDVAGPYGFGPRRFVPPAMRAEELPCADVILVSHNHYDHLDARALAAYRHKASTQVIAPLGLKPILARLGYPKVLELDWWDTWTQDRLSITTLPAVHFSGRGPFDRNRTLWASFSIASGSERIWFGGDTALGEVFAEIGRRAGPFDLALVAIGAYEPRSVMRAVHANPEEAIRIVRAINARRAVGMHWGSIMLTPEDPFEAPRRFRQAAIDQGFGSENAWILRVGETRSLRGA